MSTLAFPINHEWFSDRVLLGKFCRLLKDGTLLVDFGPTIGWRRYPISQAVFTLGLLKKWEASGDRQTLELAVKASKALLSMGTEEDGTICYRISVPILGYRLPNPWVSALAQAFAGSIFYELGSRLGEARWKDYARMSSLYILKSDFLRSHWPNKDVSWYEEYSSVPRTHVLNGHIYACIGFYELAIGLETVSFKEAFRDGIAALECALPLFDLNGLATYDGSRGILAKPYYQLLHVAQLRYLWRVTGVNAFEEYANKWESGFRCRWGTKSWAAYTTRTIHSGVKLFGLRFIPKAISYSLGDLGIGFRTRISEYRA